MELYKVYYMHEWNLFLLTCWAPYSGILTVITTSSERSATTLR